MILRYVALVVLVAGCGSEAARRSGEAAGDSGAILDSVNTQPAGPVAASRIVILGTSLTAGYGLDPDEAYPAFLQAKIDSARLGYEVVNAGVSGETSASAVRRLDWLLRDPVSVLVIETGANDGLRGQDPDSLKRNIEAIIDRAQALSPPPRILLIGMDALPNMGPQYRRRFAAVYPEVARERHVPLVPFLLDGVAGIDSLNQADGIHPTVEGQRIVARTVWKELEPLLRE